MRNPYRKMMSVAAVAAGMIVAGIARAGMLDPTNAPGPTMHTLEDIYQKLESIAGTPSSNGVSAYPALVAKTGQTNSYTIGDDGDMNKGVMWPNPRFTVQADTNVVLDNLTGLMWARLANPPGGQMDWATAIGYCKALTNGNYSDWRLPNISELQSLVDYSQHDTVLPSGHPFIDVQSDYYWSSTTHAGDADSAWFVLLSDGYKYYAIKTTSFYVWPVRGGQ